MEKEISDLLAGITILIVILVYSVYDEPQSLSLSKLILSNSS